MPGRATNNAAARLAAGLKADAADPAQQYDLTTRDVAAAVGRSTRVVQHAVDRGFLRAKPDARDGHACNVFTELEIRRWQREGNRVPTD